MEVYVFDDPEFERAPPYVFTDPREAVRYVNTLIEEREGTIDILSQDDQVDCLTTPAASGGYFEAGRHGRYTVWRTTLM